MKIVYVLCEGQTEESFIKNVLAPSLYGMEIYLKPIILTTGRKRNVKYKGGVSTYGKIKNELTLLSKSHPNEWVTTMLDYYALPTETPGVGNQNADIYQRVREIENEIESDLDLHKV